MNYRFLLTMVVLNVLLLFSFSCTPKNIMKARFDGGTAKITLKNFEQSTAQEKHHSVTRVINGNTYLLLESLSDAEWKYNFNERKGIKDLSLAYFHPDGSENVINLEQISNENNSKKIVLTTFDIDSGKKIVVGGRIAEYLNEQEYKIASMVQGYDYYKLITSSKNMKKYIWKTFVAEYDWSGKLLQEKVFSINKKEEDLKEIRILKDGYLAVGNYVKRSISNEEFDFIGLNLNYPNYSMKDIYSYDFNIYDASQKITDIFISKLNEKFEPEWVKLKGAYEQVDSVEGIEITNDGYVLFGTTGGNLFADHTGGKCIKSCLFYTFSQPAYYSKVYECNDLFVIKYGFGGEELWGKQIGKQDRKEIGDMSHFSNGGLYLFGYDTIKEVRELVKFSKENNDSEYNSILYDKNKNEVLISGIEGKSAVIYSFSNVNGNMNNKNDFKYDDIKREGMLSEESEPLFPLIKKMSLNEKGEVIYSGAILAYQFEGEYVWKKYFYFLPDNNKKNVVFLRGEHYPPLFFKDSHNIQYIGCSGKFDFFLPENAELTEEK